MGKHVAKREPTHWKWKINYFKNQWYAFKKPALKRRFETIKGWVKTYVTKGL
jgi:hypothetical protein